MSANIVTEYLNLSKQYISEYGPNTVVLYMVGSFYEIYSLQNPVTQEIDPITPIVRVCDICNLNIAQKALSEERRGSQGETFVSCMAGFRDYSLDKYLDKLVNHGFTVVVFNQEKRQMKGKKEVIERKLLNIFSPGTYMTSSLSNTILTNNIMCIWIQGNIHKHKSRTLGTNNNIICGISNCNILTAETHMFEFQSFLGNSHPTENDILQNLDELERIVSSFRPTECIIISDFNNQEHLEFDFPKYLGISETTKIHLPPIDSTKVENCQKQTYIQNLLNILGQTTYQSCKEFQENTIATQSFCFLLDFIQEHNSNLVKRLKFPIFSNISNRLLLANQTLKQLNIIALKDYQDTNSGHLSSVESFLNKCSTPMGKRLFRYKLLNPTFNQNSLNFQYKSIGLVLDKFDQPTLLNIRRSLASIKDIEKLCRQLILKRLPPNNLLSLVQSIETYRTFLNTYDGYQEILPITSSNETISNFINFLNDKFFLDKIGMEDNLGIIKPGVSLSLDLLLTQQNSLLDSIQQIQQYFSELIQEKVKIHETEKNGISIQLTKKRADILRNTLGNIHDKTVKISNDVTLVFETIKIHHSTTSYDEVDFPVLKKIAKDLQSVKEALKVKYNDVYQEVLNEIESSWYEFLYRIAQEIAEVDVLLNKAFIARAYKYCQPEIIPDTYASGSRATSRISPDASASTACSRIGPNSSKVECLNMRHLLIEHIQTNEIYVPNDVSSDGGILLTGYNGIGKSSLIRALGICIILAQSGMYVPCDKMVYSPYKSLFCCIEKRDNLFKNLSTFQLEMSELRSLLHHADEYSMFLGDELMNSTEIQSGTSIMVSVLEELTKKRVSFIIATHFNQLDEYEEISTIQDLQLKHMDVVYDHETGVLKYDRKLKNGLGNKCYGLEVARSLCLSETFIDRAFLIRNKYFPSNKGTLSMNTTKYNSKKIKGLCENCGTQMGTDTHHILEQHKADKDGFIGHVHKNHVANLKILCEKCHQIQHHQTKLTNEFLPKGVCDKME